ncbi:hypothetical protein CR105_11655 [Massilia eurypsychrophila]|uniref:Uncharacterized protein n=1 Tax=Massilia eurypsychrophila TaxID=1485217 RepID=A0A2G8TGD2_9BURK|nr:hypothetical protein [Massilia eurypsychrophila]PIL45110.1 hypothetical protein CR105_11655 [Massilia eurypsychrophila]
MQRTLIAVFANRGDAQSAIDALAAAGFSPQQMNLSAADPTGAPAQAATAHSEGIGDSIRNFLGSMFGTDDSEYVQKYSDAVTRGHHVLTLSAPNEPDVERAADIVERFGPVDIDEQAAAWSGGAPAGDTVRMGTDAQHQSASMSQQSMAGGQGAAQGALGSVQGLRESMHEATGQGSQQFFEGAAGLSPVPAQRRGVRVFDRMDDPSQGAEAETAEEIEAYYRSHHTASAAGGDFDDYEPAYRYGSEMAGGETYHGQPWRDVEPALRSDWESRHPHSAWDKMKAAVRHGWEKMTS